MKGMGRKGVTYHFKKDSRLEADIGQQEGSRKRGKGWRKENGRQLREMRKTGRWAAGRVVEEGRAASGVRPDVSTRGARGPWKGRSPAPNVTAACRRTFS